MTLVKISLIVVLLFSGPVFSQPSVAENTEAVYLQQEAISLVKRFAGILKPTLKEAFQKGGPVNAIEVCSKKAPEIADRLSQESGWQIKRVSLKPRNSKTAVPDDWERKILKQFDARQLAGEPVVNLIYSETRGQRFRFMKAQPVEALCLNCHGTSLSPDVERALTEYYPDDKATHYSLGQVRGAFSLSRELE